MLENFWFICVLQFVSGAQVGILLEFQGGSIRFSIVPSSPFFFLIYLSYLIPFTHRYGHTLIIIIFLVVCVCVFLVGGFCSPSFCAFPVIKKFIFFTIRFHVVQLMIKVIQASHICHIPLWGLLQSQFIFLAGTHQNYDLSFHYWNGKLSASKIFLLRLRVCKQLMA